MKIVTAVIRRHTRIHNVFLYNVDLNYSRLRHVYVVLTTTSTWFEQVVMITPLVQLSLLLLVRLRHSCRVYVVCKNNVYVVFMSTYLIFTGENAAAPAATVVATTGTST